MTPPVGELGKLARPEGLWSIPDALDAMWTRLQTLVAADSPSEAELAEAALILDNVAFLFVYLEGNRRHVDFEPLLAWKDAFQRNPELDARLGTMLAALGDRGAASLQAAFHALLAQRRGETGRSAELNARALAVQDEGQLALSGLLERLRVASGSAEPAAAFYRLLSGTDSSATRDKLIRVWRKQREANAEALADVVDQLIDTRRPVKRPCNIDESTARMFLDEYLTRAIENYEVLAGEIRGATGCRDDPLGHFGYFARGLAQQSGLAIPTFELQPCLTYLAAVAKSVFGVDLTPSARQRPDSMTLAVEDGGALVGEIDIDLLGGVSGAVESPYTEPRSLPVGHLLCRLRREADGVARLTFEAVHSVFHEFGHALGHVLARPRHPADSGLEYVPAERLEDLSMLTEKWVYHPGFAEALGLSDAEAVGWRLAGSIKKLEFLSTDLERAVIAAVDFDVHSEDGGGIRESYRRLDEKFGLQGKCGFEALPGYYTWPVFRDLPGMGLAYLWGAAYSSQRFLPLIPRTLSDIGSEGSLRAELASCFDYDEPSRLSDIEAVYRFYDIRDAIETARDPR